MSQSAAELLGCAPDIAAFSKLLTGGTVPLAATLATEAVFEAFLSESKVRARYTRGTPWVCHSMCEQCVRSSATLATEAVFEAFLSESNLRGTPCVCCSARMRCGMQSVGAQLLGASLRRGHAYAVSCWHNQRHTSADGALWPRCALGLPREAWCTLGIPPQAHLIKYCSHVLVLCCQLFLQLPPAG